MRTFSTRFSLSFFKQIISRVLGFKGDTHEAMRTLIPECTWEHTTMSRRNGFTLLELVIVILILGIVAAIAVPRMGNQTRTARDNAARQSLGILRNAIELYNAQNGSYPAPDSNNTLAQLLAPYLNGPFPTPGVGHHGDSSTVVTTTMTPNSSANGGWLYSSSTGDLKINGDSPYGSW